MLQVKLIILHDGWNAFYTDQIWLKSVVKSWRNKHVLNCGRKLSRVDSKQWTLKPRAALEASGSHMLHCATYSKLI